jgi:hypothetical protein
MNQRNKPLEINMIAGRVLQRSVLISCFLPSSTLLLRLNPSRVLAEVKEPLLYFSPVRRRGKAQSCTRKTETCKRRRKLYSPCIPSKISKGISVTLELMESKGSQRQDTTVCFLIIEKLLRNSSNYNTKQHQNSGETSPSFHGCSGSSGVTDGIPTSPLLKLHTILEAW